MRALVSLNLLVLSLAIVCREADAADLPFRFGLQRSMVEGACYFRTMDVVQFYGLTVEESEENGDLLLLDSYGRKVGISYHQDGVCHIYVR